MKRGILLLVGVVAVFFVALLWLLPEEGGAPREAHAPEAAPSGTSSAPGPREAPTSTRAAQVEAKVAPKAPPPPITPKSALHGLGGRQMTDVDRSALKLPEKLKGGVVVTHVEPTSPAAESQLRPDDVIARAHHSDVTSMDDLQSAVGDREQTILHVYRKGEPFNVVIHRPYDGRPNP